MTVIKDFKCWSNNEVAYKYKMSIMHTALGLAQLERIDELVERKRQIFNWYQAKLASTEGVTINYEAPGIKYTYWMVTAILDQKLGITKNQVIEARSDKNNRLPPVFSPPELHSSL